MATPRRTLLLNLTYAVVLIAAYVTISRWTSHQPLPPPPGAELTFRLPLAGSAKGDVSLASYRGRPVVLNFWASWCSVCREEKPVLVRLGASIPRAILGIATMDRPAPVAATERESPHGYPIALDSDGAVAARFGVNGLPATLVLDAEGQVIHRVDGALSDAELDLIRNLVTAAPAH